MAPTDVLREDLNWQTRSGGGLTLVEGDERVEMTRGPADTAAA